MTKIHRRPGVASVATLGVMTLSVTLAHLVAPQWSRDVGLDVWNYAEYATDVRACSERRKELEAGHDRLLHQINAGDRMAASLIDRHISLADAADEIGRVNQERSGFVQSLGFTYGKELSERQRFARYIISRVQVRLAETGETSREPEIVERLEIEYREFAAAP